MVAVSSDWTKKFEGTKFQASENVVSILNSLSNGLPLDVIDSNPRSESTVPTWHVFFKGVRVLALDVNSNGLLCRMLKLPFWPENIKTHPGFRYENWNKNKTANVSLTESSDARLLQPKLKRHLDILDHALNGFHNELQKPRLDKEHLKEQYFETEVVANLSRIEAGLFLVRRQLVTTAGRIDLLCKDANDLPVVLELKVSGKDKLVIEQMSRYVDFISDETGLDTRGIIVIKERAGSDSLASACEENDFGFVFWG